MRNYAHKGYIDTGPPGHTAGFVHTGASAIPADNPQTHFDTADPAIMGGGH